MKSGGRRFLRGGACTVLTVFLAGAAHNAGASDFYFYFDNVFSAVEVSAPAGPPPWVDAHFQDVTPGTVLLTLDNLGLSGAEFLSELYVNLSTAFDPASLDFTYVGSSGSFTLPAISAAANGYKADGDGYYDVGFAFETGHGSAERFDAGESVTYEISGIPGLVATDFIAGSEMGGGAGTWYAAAHIQGIGSSSSSVWASPLGVTPVPEPSGGALLVLGLSVGLWPGRRLLPFFCRHRV